MSALRCVSSCILTRLDVMRSLCRIEELTDDFKAWNEWCGYDADVLERIALKIRGRPFTRVPEDRYHD
jgi:hypothetical protein